MITLSSPLIHQSQKRIQALVRAYLAEHSLPSTLVQIKALEGMVYLALFGSLYRQLPGRQGNISTLVKKYDEWLGHILDTADFLASMGKPTNALAYLVEESATLNLRDLRAGRHKAGLPHDAVLYSEIEQVRDQLKGLPRKTKQNRQARVTFLTGKLTSPAMSAIFHGRSLPSMNVDMLAQADPLDIALTIVAASYGNAVRPDTLKKRLPGMRRKAEASLAQLAVLLK